jgi:hypothetical protein
MSLTIFYKKQGVLLPSLLEPVENSYCSKYSFHQGVFGINVFFTFMDHAGSNNKTAVIPTYSLIRKSGFLESTLFCVWNVLCKL